MAFLQFDATAVEAQAPAQERTLLPAGMYEATITATEIKQTKAGTGEYVRAEYTIADGEYARRKVWGNFNIKNANPEAERIGQSQLAAVCAAIGLSQIQNTEELHGKPLKIKVAVRQDATYGDSNEVKGFAKSDRTVYVEQMAAKFAAKAPVANAAPAAAKPAATPPWVKK